MGMWACGVYVCVWITEEDLAYCCMCYRELPLSVYWRERLWIQGRSFPSHYKRFHVPGTYMYMYIHDNKTVCDHREKCYCTSYHFIKINVVYMCPVRLSPLPPLCPIPLWPSRPLSLFLPCLPPPPSCDRVATLLVRTALEGGPSLDTSFQTRISN